MKRLWTSGSADIDGAYRYRLDRQWDGALGACAFVMLNPSKADAEKDDPTIRRCLGFAREWKYGSLIVVNLYPLRATDPDDLDSWVDPYGDRERNRKAIETAAKTSSLVVAAWGALRHATPAMQMAVTAVTAHKDLYCLGETKHGAPKHPLYLPSYAEPVIYRKRMVPA